MTTLLGEDEDDKNVPVAIVANKQNPKNMLKKLFPESLYHITTFLDDVELYCLEKAFPLEINNNKVSHQRWKDMLQIQKQAYTSKTMASDIVRMIQQNDGLLTRVVPLWPKTNQFFDPSEVAMIRGRKYAEQIFRLKQLRKGKDCASYFDGRIFVLTREGHHWATSRDFSSFCKLRWVNSNTPDFGGRLPTLCVVTYDWDGGSRSVKGLKLFDGLHF